VYVLCVYLCDIVCVCVYVCACALGVCSVLVCCVNLCVCVCVCLSLSLSLSVVCAVCCVCVCVCARARNRRAPRWYGYTYQYCLRFLSFTYHCLPTLVVVLDTAGLVICRKQQTHGVNKHIHQKHNTMTQRKERGAHAQRRDVIGEM